MANFFKILAIIDLQIMAKKKPMVGAQGAYGAQLGPFPD